MNHMGIVKIDRTYQLHESGAHAVTGGGTTIVLAVCLLCSPI